uniref:Uncharacterized protein n=1 Tax=Cajanus cajan TaxID=3821 RepID=A0A151TS43_CAJCA|nr:hypothetical protein KK1_009071 [Cajanus cajan]KYP69877.1 hypothetical protein KK1_009083 [Cajanus cajan]
MILRGKDIYSEEFSSSSSSSESDEEANDYEEKIEKLCPVDGDLLMVKRLLGSQPCPTTLSQRENIFHTRCLVSKRSCSLIVDSGSCFNCCSTRLVNKLALTTIRHPQPYKIHWLNEGEELEVNQQVKVKFSIRNYKDKVLCDVIPMEACHILLGRP